jgi:hypothetical protein
MERIEAEGLPSTPASARRPGKRRRARLGDFMDGLSDAEVAARLKGI